MNDFVICFGFGMVNNSDAGMGPATNMGIVDAALSGQFVPLDVWFAFAEDWPEVSSADQPGVLGMLNKSGGGGTTAGN